jgi:hypothetical protein
MLLRADAEAGYAGFNLDFDEDQPRLRLLAGSRKLAPGLAEAVLEGLAEAPALFAAALRLGRPPRPCERVEVTLLAGESTHGEALPFGAGLIRLALGEGARREDVARLARHEALHLLLAANLRGGERWNDPELAFADWIVRGIESWPEPDLPRLRAPWPRLLDPVPVSRLEVQRQLASVATSPAAAQSYFGEHLLAALSLLGKEPGDAAATGQRQLRMVEAALGAHFLEAAARSDGLSAIVLDDWLLDYQQYARAVGNPPSGAGHLWRLSEPGWSRDPLIRLSAAAQALQAHDACWFAGDRFAQSDEPVVWRNRGRVRLPLVAAPPQARPAPLHGLRAVLRPIDAPEAARLLEESARGVEGFEACALWPRLLARLLAQAPRGAAQLDSSAGTPEALPLVQVIDSAEAFAQWSAAAASLRALLGELGSWVPKVLGPHHLATLLLAPRSPGSMLLVHQGPLTPQRLTDVRRLAAQRPVRAALFTDLQGSRACQQVPDGEPPLDPRYREAEWCEGALPLALDQLPALADAATSEGRLTTQVAWLLSMMAIGVEECVYR